MRFTRFSSFTDRNVYSILPECLLQIGNQILRCLNAYGQAQQPVIQPGALQQVFWHAFVCLVERVGNQAFYAPRLSAKAISFTLPRMLLARSLSLTLKEIMVPLCTTISAPSVRGF